MVEQIIAMILLPVGVFFALAVIFGRSQTKKKRPPQSGMLPGETKDDYWNRQY